MQSEQKKLESLLLDLILLGKRVDQAVEQAKSFRVNCMEMGKQVYLLSQMLNKLLCFVTLNPILLCFNKIHCVISEVSRILQEALSLACKCRNKTIFCRLFTGTKATSFHKLYHLIDNCIAEVNWLLIIYNHDFGSALNEIFVSLPDIIINDSSMSPAWSCMVAEITIWELAIMLTSDSFPLIRMIKETEILMLCLAKLVEAEDGQLQYCCLMTISKITAAAESNLDFRCKAFKTNSPGAKAIRKQLLRVIKESDDPTLQVLAIKSIGSLARIFYERENHLVLSVLLSQLGNGHQEVATEAVVALQKFASKDNHLHKAHSERMIKLDAVQALVKLLRDGERTQQLHGWVLMCSIAMNAGYSKAIEGARIVTAIRQLLARERVCRTVFSQHPELKVLIPKALESLTLYYKY